MQPVHHSTRTNGKVGTKQEDSWFVYRRPGTNCNASKCPAVVCFLFVLLVHLTPQVSNTVCYQPFGCFSNTADFYHPIYRPVNLIPDDPYRVNTNFYFYSNWLFLDKPEQQCGKESTPLSLDQLYKPCVITTDDLLDERKLIGKLETLAKLRIDHYEQKLQLTNSLSTNPNTWSAVVVHGFLDSIKDSTWMTRIKNRLLNNSIDRTYDTVVLVDWKGGNGMPYLQATANSRLVGAQIAYLIGKLMKYLDIKLDRIHLIGHSIGSHIAGYTGKMFVRSKIGRITALDPAGPNFQGMTKKIRLDKSDAMFVDAIHTNAKPLYRFGYGMLDPIGHADFYPNGGADQTGCDLSTIPVVLDQLVRKPELFSDFGQLSQTAGLLLICSHMRAIDLFVESIPLNRQPPSCDFVSTACNSWSDFLADNCFDNLPYKSCSKSANPSCAQMGFSAFKWGNLVSGSHANNSTKFYLKTNAKPPFCKQK